MNEEDRRNALLYQERFRRIEERIRTERNMTKPTEEQIKALKPGDRLLVEATVAHQLSLSGVAARFDHPSGFETRLIDASAIHSILPREIKVGDTVKARGSPDRLVVVAVDGGEAWVKSAYGLGMGHWTAALDDLEVVS